MPPRRRLIATRAGGWRRGLARWAGRGLAAFGAALVLAGFTLAAMLRASLPAPEATLTIPALQAPVRITLDAAGVPRIAAGSEHDAAVALGLLHARDRMFQMDLMRRGAEGRLAEVLGPPALRSDRFVRTLGLAQRARADLATLPEETRTLLAAYTAGVNAWIAARGRLAAPEFIALGPPEPWAPEHSLAWAKIMGLWLSGDWRAELARERLAAAGVPMARIADLWPPDESAGRPDRVLPDQRETRRDGSHDQRETLRQALLNERYSLLGACHLDRLAAALPRFPDDPGSLPASASNAWAVAPSRSATGAALLASDPHLGFQMPPTWYLARIDLPGNVPGGRVRAGATSPGVPLIVIGRNEHLAWGFTTTHADTQDLFVERLVGEAGYQTPDGPRPFETRIETIRVRGRDAPEMLRVRETRHGPVISDLDEAVRASAGTVVAVAMANLAPADTAAQGLLALNRATSVAEARAAAALITSPPQNLTVADRAGGIALFLTGRIPRRPGGNTGWPARGWDGRQAWDGFISFDALPHVVAPESGIVANANNRVAPRGDDRLARDWPGDWRFRRIGQMLGAAPRHDAEGFAAMQMDAVSLLARDLLAPGAALQRAPRPDGAAGVALDLLRGWDGTAAADRPEPLILAAWREAVLALVLEAAAIPPAARPGGSPEFMAVLMGPGERGAAQVAAWCGGDCAALAARALERAVAGLAPRHGPDPAAWRWGPAHVARFEHPVLRFLPVLGAMTARGAATAGDGETVNRGSYRGQGSGGGAERFQNVHGAGLRLVADLGDPDATFAIIAGGQSGHPFAPHWGDLVPAWAAGRMLVLDRGPATAGRITLVP